ncbi:hypothetical protein H696_04995 [Fonticula alba]|uniref:ATP-binding protein n=1 Tax=Fonticula alba TaxID=691883 RepID=A0A058Z5A4_FONAL|nr:hypothetical protein H696_04995 [Fonticula alba]KCV68707.1 hypothetical protein H696_04995 [Fonticula alba]|eukprot:XP_009497139.1 hypothetical protein H696_04995 [Fonticula alba]
MFRLLPFRSPMGASLRQAPRRLHSGCSGGSEAQSSRAEALKAHQAARMARGLPRRQGLPGVRHIITVASGKGGVGKSTVSTNLAAALHHHSGLRVGLLDADVFGPSIPRMVNSEGMEALVDESNKLIPVQNYGLQTMSMGYLVGPDSAVVWRGLMVMKAMEQLTKQVAWKDLDVLIVDTPPGTGDTHLSLFQTLPISGAIIVSTPQHIALGDVRKGIDMFKKVNVPIVGLVQNMSLHQCTRCGHVDHIFGCDGVRDLSDEYGIRLLADLPINAAICDGADHGKPIVLSQASSPAAMAFHSVADAVADHLRRMDEAAAVDA